MARISYWNDLSTRIRLQVFILVTVIVVTAAALFYILLQYDLKSEIVMDSLTEYYGPSVRVALEAKDAVREIEEHLIWPQSGKEIFHADLITANHLLARNIDELVRLQDVHGEGRFGTTVRKVIRDYEVYLRRTESGGAVPLGDGLEILRAVEALEASLSQLQSLHEIAIDESRVRMAELSEADSRAMIYTMSIVLTVGLLLTFSIYWNMSHALNRTAAAEREKADLQEQLEKQRLVQLRADRLRSLGEMATGIAHELNQPLMGVSGIVEHLLTALERDWELSEEEQRAELKRVLDQTDRMARIVEHVRQFARQEDRTGPELVDVNDVVDNSLGLLDAQFRARGIEIRCVKGVDLPRVRGNAYSLEEVVINLLVNARDAVEDALSENGKDGDGTIEVRTYVTKGSEGDQVAIEVKDHGTGMTWEDQQRAFESFFSTKGPDRGTGLGLAISKSIVEEHKGSFDVESAKGRGTSIRMLLPVCSEGEA